MKALPRGKIGGATENSSQPFTQSDQLDETEVLPVVIDEEVYVAAIGRLVTCN